MRSNLTVVHALAPARVGGLESVVGLLARGLAERGHDIHVASVVEPEAEEHEFVQALDRRSVSSRRVEVPHRAYHVEVRRLREILADLSPDVVHTHGYRTDVVAAGVARYLGLPTVSTVHGFTGGGWKNRLYEWLQRRSLARMDAVVAVSRRLGRELREAGVDGRRLHVVRNAWRSRGSILPRAPARQKLGLPEDAFVVGWVGRLSHEKGPDVLVRAAEKDVDSAIYSIVGPGPERGDLTELTENLGVGDRIRFHGLVKDAAKVYRAFDVFALSSRTEGTPVSLFEAMEAGVPVVATDVGGVPDVVRHEREALLVPPEDPEALADAVSRVRRNPDAARQRVCRARARLEREFAPGPWVDRYEGVYRQAVAQP